MTVGIDSFHAADKIFHNQKGLSIKMQKRTKPRQSRLDDGPQTNLWKIWDSAPFSCGKIGALSPFSKCGHFPLSEPAGRVWEVERPSRRTGEKYHQVSGGTIFQPNQRYGVNFDTALQKRNS
jgi:hypothetical protein